MTAHLNPDLDSIHISIDRLNGMRPHVKGYVGDPENDIRLAVEHLEDAHHRIRLAQEKLNQK